MSKEAFSFQDNITKSLKGMVDRANAMSSYLNKNLFKQYQKAQIARFESENETETGQWQPLNTKYLAQKKKKASKNSWPGAGNAIMIASGKLKDAATARSQDYLKLVTNTSFTVSINTGAIPYAIYPGVMRPFMEFSQETEDEFSKGITDFITKNLEPHL